MADLLLLSNKRKSRKNVLFVSGLLTISIRLLNAPVEVSNGVTIIAGGVLVYEGVSESTNQSNIRSSQSNVIQWAFRPQPF